MGEQREISHPIKHELLKIIVFLTTNITSYIMCKYIKINYILDRLH